MFNYNTYIVYHKNFLTFTALLYTSLISYHKTPLCPVIIAIYSNESKYLSDYFTTDKISSRILIGKYSYTQRGKIK